ncbi:MAG: carbohydrate ABC transporter permease [Crenarchaeota archaeon]|nr:carbohydrate ABC transporter permease [Thermoproteota archaeon]
MRSYKDNEIMKAKNIVIYFLIAACLAWFSFPIAWAVLGSFKTRFDFFSTTPLVFFSPTLENYVRVFSLQHIERNLINSLLVSVPSALLGTFVGAMAGYSLARFKFWGRDNLAYWFLSMRIIPPIVVLPALYFTFLWLGLVGTPYSLIILYPTFIFPFTVWMMRSFFTEVPVQCEEAATLEGCSRLQVLRWIVLPLCQHGLFATFTFVLVVCWNEFMAANILTVGESKTVPVQIASYVQPWGTDWGSLLCTVVISIAPLIVITFLVQKYMVRAFTTGAVKG